MAAVGTAGSVPHSVHPMGMTKPTAPNFGDLGKPIVTVDVARLQAELRSLHQRLELLEVAALVAAEEQEKQEDLDGGSGSSASGEAAASNVVDRGHGGHAEGLDNNSDFTADDTTLGTTQGGGSPSPLLRSATGLRKRAAGATAALQAELGEVAERVEALAASFKRREKAQGLREKATGLARSMEIRRIQLAVESRITSDDLQLAVSATDDKIAAMQSAVDSALSDRFRRMQDVVHEQMASLLSMVQALTQQQGKGGINTRGSHVLTRGMTSGGDGGAPSDGSDDDDDEEEREAFNKEVTDIVNRLMKEADKKPRGGGDVRRADFESLQEDYETFKGHMEEKADRQDELSSTLEDTQARMDDAEANISALTEELERSSQDIQEAADAASDRQSDLEARVRNASSIATDATGECAAIRLMVGESRRELQAEARQDAEAISARAEARTKADVSKARGDARTATEKLASELKRYIKKSDHEAEGHQGAIAGTRTLSEKALAGAAAAATRVEEANALLRKAEERLGQRLDEAVLSQTAAVEDTLERIAAGELELARVESELRRLLNNNGAEITDLRTGQKRLRESSDQATQKLKEEVKGALTRIVVDQDYVETPAGGSNSSGGGRARARGGGSVAEGRSNGVRFGTSTDGNNNGGPAPDAEDRSSLASLGAALRRQAEEAAHNVSTLQRSGVGIVTILRKMEAGVQALSTRDLFWKAVDVKLSAHQRAVSELCLQVERDTMTRRSRITLSKEAQVCLAGDMQRVAKLIATKADYDVIRELAKLEGPEQTGQDWDERVEFLRQAQMKRFLSDCRDALDKSAPEIRTNFQGEEIRGKFFGKLNDALRVALSKYSPTTPGATLFGKIKLKAKACLACDRPFTPSATGRPGPTPTGGISGAAVEPDGIPEENSHITKDTFRPQTSHGRLGSPSRSGSVELFEPHTSIHSVMSGGRSSPDSPHVYRGGFKLPKHLKSPLHLSEGEDQSAFGIGHASPLLHKCPSMTGLGCYNEGRPSTSGGTRHKGRPPSNKNSSKFNSPPATADSERPNTAVGGQDRGGGSVVSAFTTRSEYTKANGGAYGGGGGGSARDGMVMEFGDDPSGAPALPYYATTLTISRPSTPHDGSVRLLT